MDNSKKEPVTSKDDTQIIFLKELFSMLNQLEIKGSNNLYILYTTMGAIQNKISTLENSSEVPK